MFPGDFLYLNAQNTWLTSKRKVCFGLMNNFNKIKAAISYTDYAF